MKHSSSKDNIFKALKKLKATPAYATVGAAKGFFEGISRNKLEEIRKGDSVENLPVKLAVRDAVTGALFGAALEMLSDSEIRKTKEGKALAATAASFAAALSLLKPVYDSGASNE